MENKNILVTGGCGFIGSNFINHLIDNYDEFNLINVDYLGIGSDKKNINQPKSDKQDISTFEIDISNDFKKSRDISGLSFDYLFHFAAESHVDRSISSPDGFVSSNVMGTLHMLEYARLMGVKRVINVSTDEVTGSILKGSVKEFSKYNPSSVYSATKAAGELLCNSYKEMYPEMDIITTRCTNNFGANQFTEKFIPTIISKASNGENIPIYDKGLQCREWTHVSRHIHDLLLVAEYGKKGEIYNVGDGYEMTNIDIAKLILKILDIPDDKFEFIPNARVGHDFRYSINTSKIDKLREKYNRPLVPYTYDSFYKDLEYTIESYI